MKSEAIITVLSSTLSLLAIWWGISWLFRSYRVESMRDQLFELRAELFDEAYSRESFTFGHPAYGILRTTINGFIRFGHRTSLSQILVMLFFIDLRSVSSFSDRLENAAKDMDDEAKQKLDGFSERMNEIVANHLILSSPLLLVTVIVPLCFLFFATYCWGWTARLLHTQIDGLDSLAMVKGEQLQQSA